MESITLAGGCFWCTEAIFQRLKGVTKVVSGYTGGDVDSPSYDQVSTGATNHAEAIQLTFDPRIITLDQILEIFWATHDPTSLNRQGADVGTQYRSAIFVHNSKQKDLAEKSLQSAQKLASGHIVTEIKSLVKFYPAEDYHQNYFNLNQSSNSYCSIVIEPKIEKLIQKFNKQIKEEYKK
jgi:peptide-methionine (S)-S-oxide reductase